MKDVVQLSGDMHELADIVMIEFELLQLEKMLDVPEVSGDEVVHADDREAFTDETVAEMGAEETGRAGDQYSFHGVQEVTASRPML
jgi:hypothetical protein